MTPIYLQILLVIKLHLRVLRPRARFTSPKVPNNTSNTE